MDSSFGQDLSIRPLARQAKLHPQHIHKSVRTAMLLAALLFRAKGLLNSLMLLTAFVQLVDLGVDWHEGRWAVIPSVVVVGVLFFVGAWTLSGFPFWRAEAWRA